MPIGGFAGVVTALCAAVTMAACSQVDRRGRSGPEERRRASLGPDAAATTLVISLPSDLSAVAIARQFVEDNRDHIRPDLIDDAQVLVSEVVTNAVRHGGPEITLLVRVDRRSIGVAVADSGDNVPAKPQRPPPSSQPSGRGLMIVDALASAWGVEPNTDPLLSREAALPALPHCALTC